MGIFDVLVGLAGGAGSGYLEADKAAQEAKDRAEVARQREAATVKDRLAQTQAEMQQRQETENLVKAVTGNAANAATKTMTPAGPSEQPLPPDQAGPVAPPTKANYEVPDAALQGLPSDRRESAKAGAINIRKSVDEAASSKDELNQSLVDRRGAQNQVDQYKALLEQARANNAPAMLQATLAHMIAATENMGAKTKATEAKTAAGPPKVKPPAALLARAGAAQAALDVTKNIKAELAKPEVLVALGPFAGRATSVQDLFGNPPPELKKLAGALHGYMLNTMGVHGMRSAKEAQNLFDESAGFKYTPEAINSALDGLNGIPESLVERYGSFVGGNEPAAAAGPKTIATAADIKALPSGTPWVTADGRRHGTAP